MNNIQSKAVLENSDSNGLLKHRVISVDAFRGFTINRVNGKCQTKHPEIVKELKDLLEQSKKTGRSRGE